MHHRYVTTVADKEVIIETGTLAQQAGGAVTVRTGDSVIFAAATAAKQPREGIDFFPLTVDYEERLYAAGRIPGSFFRREGRPSEQAILLCRLVDRPLRPLFDKGTRNDVQVILVALSSDQENQLDVLSVVAASAALTISDIPWAGPIGAVRIGLIDGQLVVNPLASQMKDSTLDLRLAGTKDSILMVEAGASEVPEKTMLEAMKLGHEVMQPLIELQEQMRAEIGKPKREFQHFLPGEEVAKAVEAVAAERIQQLLGSTSDKRAFNDALDKIKEETVSALVDKFDRSDITTTFHDVLKHAVRERILSTEQRPDGRGVKEIRPISAQVGLLPRTHGSGLFTRGETQVLTLATLGMPREAQTLDTLGVEEQKRYLHHYNFPPYSTGETWPLRGPKRREIGHGALAERALEPMIPPQEEFPYTLRLVSEVMSSNGSTSMASVCGSTLALMDAGVPIKEPVAGIAMGLVTDGNVHGDQLRYKVLTDIQGMEDALGDMDFKVAGTRNGINALQMDIKLQGLNYQILTEALAQAREARLFILDKMLSVLPAPRKELSPYAPRLTSIQIDQEKIGKLIGPGGKNIRRLQEEYKVQIDVQENGTVFISGVDGQGADAAEIEIRSMMESPEIGRIYTGKVVRVESYGAFVEILPGMDGLVHISQIADYRVPDINDVVKLGDEIMVMVIDIDPNSGKIKLSRQAVLEGWSAEEARQRDRKPSGGRSSSRDRRGGSRSGGRHRSDRSGGHSTRH